MDSTQNQESILVIAISCPKFMEEDRCQQLIELLWVIHEKVMATKKISQIIPYLLPGKDLRNLQGTFKKTLEDSQAATFICDTLADESIGESRNTTYMFKKLSEMFKDKKKYSFLIISDGKFNFEPFKNPLRPSDPYPFNATVLHIMEKVEKTEYDTSFLTYCYAMYSRLKFDHQYLIEELPANLVSKKSTPWAFGKVTDPIFQRIVEDQNSNTGVKILKDKKEKETFDDFIKIIVRTDSNYIAPIIKEVNIKSNDPMVESETDITTTTESSGQLPEEEKLDRQSSNGAEKSNYVLFVLDSGLDFLESPLEKLSSEFKTEIMVRTIKIEEEIPKDARSVIIFLHLSMNIPESKEKKCFDFKEAYGPKLKILYTKQKEARQTWQKLSMDKFKDVVYASPIEYKIEVNRTKSVDPKEFSNVMKTILANEIKK